MKKIYELKKEIEKLNDRLYSVIDSEEKELIIKLIRIKKERLKNYKAK